MVKIDEDLCNGCGECIPNCHEGALQIIDNKARLISDLLCDGLGACIGHCPMSAITVEKREAEAYDETKVMELMIEKGKNTVIAHMKHLKDHNETAYLKEAVAYLKTNEEQISFSVSEVIQAVHNHGKIIEKTAFASALKIDSVSNAGGGCPGSAARSLEPKGMASNQSNPLKAPSELRQWPVQMHLINPSAGYFKGTDILIAADCIAYAMGNFHDKLLKGKSLAIACPKLDDGQDIYLAKMIALIDQAQVNTITVAMMTVPCCGGLGRLVKTAAEQAIRKVPVKFTFVSAEGEVVKEEWV